MRKFVFALVIVAVLFVSCAYADDGEKLIIDDVTLGQSYRIKGYAVVTFQEFNFWDSLVGNGTNDLRSGNEADYAWLRCDIRNLSKKDAKFLSTMTVRAVYDDEYEYSGFVRQYYYDSSKDSFIDGEISIGSLYTGHYGFGCVLPNFVVQDKTSPLKMIITINGHEFTYYIRK